jgi:hypothetical protein
MEGRCAYILNKQSGTNENWGAFSLGVGRGAKTFTLKNTSKYVTKIIKEPPTWTGTGFIWLRTGAGFHKML